MSGAVSRAEEEDALVRVSDDLVDPGYRSALSALLERELEAIEATSAAEERERRARTVGLLEGLLPEVLG